MKTSGVLEILDVILRIYYETLQFDVFVENLICGSLILFHFRCAQHSATRRRKFEQIFTIVIFTHLPLGAPPNTQVFLTLEDFPNSMATSWICWASSLVGAKTKTMGPSPKWKIKSCKNLWNRRMLHKAFAWNGNGNRSIVENIKLQKTR